MLQNVIEKMRSPRSGFGGGRRQRGTSSMEKQEITKGRVLHHQGETVKRLELVLKGSVSVHAGDDVALQAGNGAILGAFTPAGGAYRYDYTASEDGLLAAYDYNSEEDLVSIIESAPNIAPVMASASIALVNELVDALESLYEKGRTLVLDLKSDYADYRNVCARMMVAPQKFDSVEGQEPPERPDILSSWQTDLCRAWDEQDETLRKVYYPADIHFCVGNILLAAQMAKLLQPEIDAMTAFLRDVREQTDDFLREYRTQKAKLEEAKRQEALGAGGGELPAIQNAMDTIVAFSGVARDVADAFRKDVGAFARVTNKTERSDTLRRLRRSITENFYLIYEAAFFRSLAADSVPAEVKMFFLFGFVDENLAGTENTAALYKYALLWEDDPDGRILTAYDWLRKIYAGEVPPSKNEFDQDWSECVKEQLRTHEITDKQAEALMTDGKAMVHFELSNMIARANKMTYGSVLSFVPVFFAEEVVRPLEKSFASPAAVRAALDHVRSMDYSCFYRPAVTSYMQWKINMFEYHVEVLPYVILMPNFGSRGVMWQEIEGRRRTTPAHFVLSIFHSANLEDTVLNMCAQFRWEMCKRIQGVHYGDIKDPSLTSEYIGYLQFYKKNHDLSAAMKEKVKQTLKRYRNSYRDVFIAEYEIFLQNESSGMARLNKVSRDILFKYCTFSEAYRESLGSNPQYAQLISAWTSNQKNKVQTMNFMRQKIQRMGGDVPEEVDREIAFLQM